MQANGGWGFNNPPVPDAIPPADPPAIVDRTKPHALIQRARMKDFIIIALAFSIVLTLMSMNYYTAKVCIYFAYANIVIGLLLLCWFYIIVPIGLALVRIWFGLLEWLLIPDGYAIRLARLQADCEDVDIGLAEVGGAHMPQDTAVDVRLEEAIEGEFTNERRETRRQRYRRLNKNTLVVKMVQHARRKLGMGHEDKAETRMALDKIMREFCSDLCVRHKDRDCAMPWAKQLYFLPTEDEIGAHNMARGWFVWMQKMRFRGWSWAWLGVGSPSVNSE